MSSFSIWHWIILALFILAVYSVYRLARSKPSKPPSAQPSGVGGWLLLLVAGLIVLGPLFNAGRINADLLAAEEQYPRLQTLATWQTYKTATWLTYLAITAVSIWAGYGLAKGRESSVVRRAQFALWIIGPVGSILLGIVIPLSVFSRSGITDPEFVGSFIANIVIATIWTLYLSKSKRVRLTYVSADEWRKARASYEQGPVVDSSEGRPDVT